MNTEKNRRPAGNRAADEQAAGQKLNDSMTQSPDDVLTEHIRRTVATFPPLTNEQRDKVALLLRGAA